MCVQVRQVESDGLHTLQEIPLFCHNKLAELLTPGAHNSSEYSFTLTTVDGSRVDDISISFKRNSADAVKREPGCFRSLFKTERCPASFMYGSQFYCFPYPGTESSVPGCSLTPKQNFGLNKHVELSLLPPTSLCSYSEKLLGEHAEGGSEEEEKLAIMYERLRTEVRMYAVSKTRST